MSQENVEVVREQWRAWARDGIDGLADLVAEDSVVYAFPGWIGKSKQVGPDGVRAMGSEWNEAFTDFDIELSDLREYGDRVVALLVQRGVTREAGVLISQEIGAVYSDFRENGRIGEARFFPSWDEALAAAGLSE
jgi:ketosteroid isomerase-like protein